MDHSSDNSGLRKSKHAKALQKIMEPEVRRLSEEEMKSYRSDFYQMRSGFAAWCTRNQMFYTLALLTACEIEMRDDFPSIAGVSALDKLVVMFHPLAVELWRKNPDDAYFLFVHELRHIVQASNLLSVEKLVDLEPIREVLVKKRDLASAQENKDIWQKQIDKIDDPENQQWKHRRHQIANVTMDAALHVDVMKLFPNSQNRINTFLRETFIPYASGFSFESQAKDVIAAGRQDEVIQETIKNFGPAKKKHFEEMMAKNKNIVDFRLLAELMKMNVHIQTIETVEDGCRNLPHYQPDFKRDSEWLGLADEYVRWLAEQIDDSQNPDSPPQNGSGEGDGDGDPSDILQDLMDDLEELDSHEFGDGQSDPRKREEAERRIRDALRRAEEEGKIMSHRAGVGAGDREMFGDSATSLNKKIQDALEKIRIKFVRIFAESNSKKYTFQRINRLFSEIAYIPGKQKETRPKPQVVFVLDTSGSMYSKHYINQMLAMARRLHKQGKLASMYYCDTQLHKASFEESKREYEVIGGGGTELSVPICEDIMKRENLKEGWELVYATDEYCPGLEEAKKDRRWKIHVINVPRMLGENI